MTGGSGQESGVRVVPARLGHVLRVARRLDPELMRRAEAAGIDVRRLLADALRDSREAWALLADGNAVAAGGWKGTLLAGEAEAWLAVTGEARAYPVVLARAVAREAQRLILRGTTISASVLADDAVGNRFAAWCGLVPAGDHRGGMRKYRSIEFTYPAMPQAARPAAEGFVQWTP